MSVDGIARGGAMPLTDAGVGAGRVNSGQALQTGGVNEARLAAILQEMQELSAKDSDNGETPPPSGGPSIDPPKQTISPEDATLLLQAMQSKLTDSQIKTAKEGIKMDAEQKDRLHQESMKKIEEAAKKLAKSNKFGIAGKVLGIVAKVATVAASIAGCVAAAALMVGSFGVGTPAAAALFAISATSLVMASVDLASDISQAAGGPAFSLATGVSAAVTKALVAMGVDEKDAERAGQFTGMVVEVAVAIGMAAASFAVAPFTGGASLTGTVASVAKFAKVASAIANLAGGVVETASAGVTAAKGAYEYQAANAKADKLDIDKIIQKLQQQLEENTDRVEELVQQIEEAMQAVNSIIAGSSDTKMQIARRMV